MPDWFTENAPPKAAANGDWFADNAPQEKPTHVDTWGDVVSDLYHGAGNSDFRKGFSKSVVSDPQMLGAAGAAGALALAPTLPVTGPLALLAAAGLGAFGGAGGAATAHGIGAVVGQEPRNTLGQDMAEQGIAGGVAPLLGPAVKGTGVLQQKVAGKLAPLAEQYLPWMGKNASMKIPGATFLASVLSGRGVVEPALESAGEHLLLNPGVGRGMEQLGDILANPLNALRQSRASKVFQLDNHGGGTTFDGSGKVVNPSTPATPPSGPRPQSRVQNPVQTQRAPYGNQDIPIKPRWARADAKAAKAAADEVDPFASTGDGPTWTQKPNPTIEAPPVVDDAVEGLQSANAPDTDSFYGTHAVDVEGDPATAMTSAHLKFDPRTSDVDMMNQAILDGDIPQTGNINVLSLKGQPKPSGDSFGAKSFRQRAHITEDIDRKRAAIEALRAAADEEF